MRPFILSVWIIMALAVSACSGRAPEIMTEPVPYASPAAEEDSVPPTEEISPVAEEKVVEALKEESEAARFAVDEVQEDRADQPEEPAAEITSAETPLEPSNEQPSLSTNDATAEPYTPPQEYESPGLSATWTAPEQKPVRRFRAPLLDCEQLGLANCP
jgi:hypothetical protein